MNGTLSASSFSCFADRQERRPGLPVCHRPSRSRATFRKTGCSEKLAHWPVNTPVSSKSRTTTLGPFGEVIRQTGPMAKVNPIRFSTKYQDDESDLLYYGYRYYKASTGTWVSRDPSGEKNGKNLYGFAENNAPNKFDTLGLLVGKVWFQQYYPYMNTSLFWAERGIRVFLLWSPPDSWGDKPCCRCMAAVWMQYKMDGTIDIPMNDDESTGAWYCDAPTKPAILTDQPHVGNVSYWALKPLSPYTWNFKSVLMCNEGKDVGKVYATVYWGGTYTYDSMPVTFPPIIQ